MILRVFESEWNEFTAGLCARTDVETAGIVLAERLHGGEVLLVRDMIEIPPEGYLIRRQDHVRITDGFPCISIDRIACAKVTCVGR
jgi:hypothetical protein